MNSFHFLKSKRKFKFDINGGIGIMSQFFVNMEAVILIAKSKCLVPFNAQVLPFLKPYKFSSRADKKLHFHLLKFAHSEYKLACNNLVPESLPDLSNTERNFHPSGFLHIHIVDKNSLCCFGAKVNFQCTVGS